MDFKLPTETIELPSKGLLYPEGHPLSSGTIEMKYMTAKEEDILTNKNYIRQGLVIDKLLQSLIVTDVDYNDILIGDKNAIMLAARILSYGKDYEFTYGGTTHTADLSTFDAKPLDEAKYKKGVNEFEFTLPTSNILLTFKLLTHKDERAIEAEVKGLQKINKDNITEATTRLKHMITSINGSTEGKDIRQFVDNAFLARDARAFRQYYAELEPNVNFMTSVVINSVEEDVDLPITLNFFWPES